MSAVRASTSASTRNFWTSSWLQYTNVSSPWLMLKLASNTRMPLQNCKNSFASISAKSAIFFLFFSTFCPGFDLFCVPDAATCLKIFSSRVVYLSRIVSTPNTHGQRVSHRQRQRVGGQSENQRMSMRIDLEVLSSFDFIITTSTRDGECVRV